MRSKKQVWLEKGLKEIDECVWLIDGYDACFPLYQHKFYHKQKLIQQYYFSGKGTIANDLMNRV